MDKFTSGIFSGYTPNRFATLIASRTPICSTKRTVGTLRDVSSARRNGTSPKNFLSLFSGRHSVSASFHPTIGASSNIASGERPFSNAAKYTNGLIVLPIWRIAWVARLNELSAKLRPPDIANTRPVYGFITIIAPCNFSPVRPAL